jgi:hypothetical protein
MVKWITLIWLVKVMYNCKNSFNKQLRCFLQSKLIKIVGLKMLLIKSGSITNLIQTQLMKAIYNFKNVSNKSSWHRSKWIMARWVSRSRCKTPDNSGRRYGLIAASLSCKGWSTSEDDDSPSIQTYNVSNHWLSMRTSRYLFAADPGIETISNRPRNRWLRGKVRPGELLVIAIGIVSRIAIAVVIGVAWVKRGREGVRSGRNLIRELSEMARAKAFGGMLRITVGTCGLESAC